MSGRLKLRIWTDGCCLRNPGGPGGWAFVAEEQGAVLDERHGAARITTNNTMELEAVRQALSYVHEFDPAGLIQICSDSRYVVDGLNLWVPRWAANGWKRKGRKGGASSAPIKNLNQWKAIEELRRTLPHQERRLLVRWVKGHAGAQFNERADALANEAARYGQDAVAA